MPSAAQLQAVLNREERNFRIRWITLLILGAIVMMFGPLIIGTFYWLYAMSHGNPAATWIRSVTLVTLIVLPVLFALEWSTRGEFLSSAVDDMDTSTIGGSYVARRAGGGLLLLEISLWGPRMVISGTQKLMGMSRVHSDPALSARLLVTLLARGEGMPTEEVLDAVPGREEDAFKEFEYLKFFGWIDIAKDGKRVWLCSDMKGKLLP